MRKAHFLVILFAMWASAAFATQAGAAQASATDAASNQDAAQGDLRVAEQLDRLGLHYELTESNNYSVTYDLDGGRSQVAYVTADTETYKGVEIRELWSRAGTFDEIPSADTMEKLLEDTGTEKIGAWALEKSSEDGYILYYSIRVPVSLQDSQMGSLLRLAADVADQKESELFQTDDE
jgi:hypothetical protein